jgi:hypothetical protein
MCVLYDMGYTLPDYQTAYLNAMDLASSALDKCVYDYPMNDFSGKSYPWKNHHHPAQCNIVLIHPLLLRYAT